MLAVFKNTTVELLHSDMFMSTRQVLFLDSENVMLGGMHLSDCSAPCVYTHSIHVLSIQSLHHYSGRHLYYKKSPGISVCIECTE